MYYHPFAGIRCKTQTSTTKKGIIMDTKTKEIAKAYDAAHQLNRIADALEEVLRLVKEDQERSRKYMEKESE
jgi:negative regulator of sigma E activity